MFGHGSYRCKVKTFCSNCAGQHNTSDCKESTPKCANCSGPHKSTFDECPSKINYLNIRQRAQPAPRRPVRASAGVSSSVNYSNNFPNTLRQSTPSTSSNWQGQTDFINNSTNSNNANNNKNSSNDLFTLEEIKNLTLELITNLRNCKNKSDQFEVITNLACKFLA